MNLKTSIKREKMLTQISLFLCLALLSILPFSVNAKLTQSIDRTEIHAGESFLLTLQVDEDTGEQPDLSLIPKEFTIISNSQYQQMSYVNGRSSIIKGWKIKLSTLSTGRVTIPPIAVGNEQTTAITLLIKDTSDRVDLNGQKKAIFLESSVDQPQVYVQQQVLFTVKLFRAVNTHYARLTEPTAGDSIIEKLGDDIQYDKMIENTRYVVTERRYAIFPQQSGQLNIDAINFTADVNDPSQANRNRFLNTTRPISVNSKKIELKVIPQPPAASSPWLPASEVVLADKWSDSTGELTVGEPVTWTLLLYAQGLSESQLPEITLPKVDGLQWYPDTPQKERQVNGKGILGQRVEKLAVIPSKQGKITIPEVQVKWWDTKNNVEKTATIAARTFNVLPAVANANNAQPPQMVGPVIETKAIVDNSRTQFWKIIAAAIFILWLFTLLAYFKKKTQPSPQRQKRRIQQIEKIQSQSALVKSLMQAIKLNQIENIETDLLEWSSNLTATPIHSLGHLINRIKDKDLIDKLSQLESQRYAANKTDYRCDLSKTDFDIISSELTSHKHSHSHSHIPPLYAR
jgi:hypothetical protein